MENIRQGLLFVSFVRLLATVFAVFGTMALSLATEFPEVQIANFQGHYQGGTGQVSADRFHLPSESDWRQVNFLVFKESTQMRFQGPFGDVVWEDVPRFLLDLNEVSWLGAYANTMTTPNRVRLGFTSFEGRHPQQILSIRQFELSCEASQKSLFHSAMESCIERGRLSWDHLETSSQSSLKHLKKFLIPLGFQMQQSQVQLEDLNLTIDQGRLNLSVKADLDIRLSLKAEGRVSFSPGATANSGELTLKLDKVKAGFLNVTGRVFSELEKLNHPQLKVARPFIYLTIP
jgi:hypothetical protein